MKDTSVMQRYRAADGLKGSVTGCRPSTRGREATFMLSIISGVLLLALSIDEVLAQVTVHPATICLSRKNERGRFTVLNRGTSASIINVQARFGYPVSDSCGDVSFRFIDSADREESSMYPWVSIYPAHFELAPGESQVVVLVAHPPENLPDGEYWLRPEFDVRTPLQESMTRGTSSAVKGHEHYQYVPAVIYRQGIVHTGVSIRSKSVTLRNKKLVLLVDLQREGNAAYRGNILCSLRDMNGGRIVNAKREVAVYHSMRYRFEMGSDKLADGSYTIRIELNTDRSGDVLQCPPTQKSIALMVRNGCAFVNQPDDSSGRQTPLIGGGTSLLLANQMPDEHTLDSAVASQHPHAVAAVQDTDRINALVQSHCRARVLEKRLKEINREQDMILRELHELLTVIVQ